MNPLLPAFLGLPIVIVLVLMGCHSPDIKDTRLNDRVKACSAGFSDGIQSSLSASANKLALNAALTGEFKEETKSIIFSELPESDRLKGYEDYIKCVETNWNKEEK